MTLSQNYLPSVVRTAAFVAAICIVSTNSAGFLLFTVNFSGWLLRRYLPARLDKQVVFLR
jgi:hypothetical protein